MQIRLQGYNDTLELFALLEQIDKGEEKIECPPYRNIFYGYEDFKKYLEERAKYREYIKQKGK